VKTEVNEKKVAEFAQGVLAQVKQSAENLGDTQVADHADYEEACQLLFEVVVQERAVDEYKAEVLTGAKAIVAAVGKACKPLEAEVGGLVAKLKGLVRDYAVACEERHDKALKKAALLARTDAKQARKLTAEAEDLLPPKVAGIAFQQRREVKVLDEAKVPERFFRRVVDDAALRAAAEAGELDDKTAAQWGLLVEDARIVKVTPSQRELGSSKGGA